MFRLIKSLLTVLLGFLQVNGCYWNAQSPYQLFGSKTPYETVRGDIRDYKTPKNCEAVSIWKISRHGNRSSNQIGIKCMKNAASLKDEILASYEQGTSQLCAQDIDHLREWSWNDTLHVSPYYLTGAGSEELHGIGKRIREKYPHLFQGTADQFYFRSTGVQRTIASRIAFVQGLTEGINLNVTVEKPLKRDDVIAAYHTCNRYQQTIRSGKTVIEVEEMYYKSWEYLSVQNAVQNRLGISTKLNPYSVHGLYNLCRYYRSWSPELRSPWCAVFSNEDLIILEYYDDVIHYYRNGYGSRINVDIGKSSLKDLYKSFEAVVNGAGRRLTAYFTHETMTEMVCSAMGLYAGDDPPQAGVRKVNRVWRTSYLAAFAFNIVAVLNSCKEADHRYYNVQFFVNEKETPICSQEGCTWQEFQNKFQTFTSSNLSSCSMDYVNDATDASVHFF